MVWVGGEGSLSSSALHSRRSLGSEGEAAEQRVPEKVLHPMEGMLHLSVTPELAPTAKALTALV